MKPLLFRPMSAVISILLFAACTSVPSTQQLPLKQESVVDIRTRSTKAFITACDRVLLRSTRSAEQMDTVAGRNDEMIAACDSILAVSSSPSADPKIVAEYRAAVRAMRKWFVARPDWRTLTAGILMGSAAAVIDASGGGGLALTGVVASETKRVADLHEVTATMRTSVERCNRALAEAGYESEFFRTASA